MAKIDLDQFGSTARYVRIAEDLRAKIHAGSFGSRGRLPATRDLARRLGVHRNTVVAAYGKLEEWGLARGHVGRGTFASRSAEEAGDGEKSYAAADDAPGTRSGERSSTRASRASSPGARHATAFTARSGAPWAGAFARGFDGRAIEALSAIYTVGSSRGGISFAGSFPAADLLPVRSFGRALARALESRPDRSLSYGQAQGYLPLRKWIANDMSRRGMKTSSDEVLITNGSQQAIDLIARALIDPGDLVILEDPTYSGAIASFQSHGARLSGAPLDEEGILPGSLAGPASRGSAKLAYLTPSFQNPTTAVLPLQRREQVLREAAESNLLLVEDDWAGALRFEGEGPPTLRALDREGRVIYLSTFAKMLIPGLRVGWIAAARPIIERLTALKQISDCCTSPLVQCALDLFCREGGLDRHLVRVRAAYRVRRDRMIAALESELPWRASLTSPPGGLFLWVPLPDRLEAGLVASECEARGVLVSRSDPFYLDGGGPPRLRLTFASSRPSQIDRGIRILGSVLKKQLSTSGRRRTRAAAEAVPLV